MTRIWLIRHAESIRVPGSVIGVTDPPLSEAGVEQARSLGEAMAAHPLVRVLSSDRERALATARQVARPHGLSVEPAAALREIDFGAWEGRNLADLWSEEPDAAMAWEEDLRSSPPSFGESVSDLERRVSTFWSSLRPLPSVGEVAIVAHRGSLAVLQALITGSLISETFASGLALGAAEAVFAG